MYASLDSPPKLITPFGMLISGPTMVGKSSFVFRLLNESKQVMTNSPERIVYAYGQWQDGFNKLQSNIPGVEFVKGIRSIVDNEDFFDPSQRNLLVIDDLASEIAKSDSASNLFTQGIHHRNTSVIYITQNLYKQGKAMRDIQLNCQYLVLFKNARDLGQVSLLGRQMGIKNLPDAYTTCTQIPYQPLVIDLTSFCPAYLRLRSHIFPEEVMRIYTEHVPKCLIKPDF